MRYAIVSDIHANLQAWKAVLADIRAQGVDQILCLGDIVGYGPRPAEVLTSVHSRVHLSLVGNHDAVVAGKMDASLFNDDAARMTEWTRQRLNEKAVEFLRGLPLIHTEANFRCAHGNVAPTEYVRYVDTHQDARDCWDACVEKLVFVGHTHIPKVHVLTPSNECRSFPLDSFELEEDRRYIVNVGSVGFSRDGDFRGSYCIYDAELAQVYNHRVAYDVEAFRTDVREQIGTNRQTDYVLSLFELTELPTVRPTEDFGQPATSVAEEEPSFNSTETLKLVRMIPPKPPRSEPEQKSPLPAAEPKAKSASKQGKKKPTFTLSKARAAALAAAASRSLGKPGAGRTTKEGVAEPADEPPDEPETISVTQETTAATAPEEVASERPPEPAKRASWRSKPKSGLSSARAAALAAAARRSLAKSGPAKPEKESGEEVEPEPEDEPSPVTATEPAQAEAQEEKVPAPEPAAGSTTDTVRDDTQPAAREDALPPEPSAGDATPSDEGPRAAEDAEAEPPCEPEDQDKTGDTTEESGQAPEPSPPPPVKQAVRNKGGSGLSAARAATLAAAARRSLARSSAGKPKKESGQEAEREPEPTLSPAPATETAQAEAEEKSPAREPAAGSTTDTVPDDAQPAASEDALPPEPSARDAALLDGPPPEPEDAGTEPSHGPDGQDETGNTPEESGQVPEPSPPPPVKQAVRKKGGSGLSAARATTLAAAARRSLARSGAGKPRKEAGQEAEREPEPTLSPAPVTESVEAEAPEEKVPAPEPAAGSTTDTVPDDAQPAPGEDSAAQESPSPGDAALEDAGSAEPRKVEDGPVQDPQDAPPPEPTETPTVEEEPPKQEGSEDREGKPEEHASTEDDGEKPTADDSPGRTRIDSGATARMAAKALLATRQKPSDKKPPRKATKPAKRARKRSVPDGKNGVPDGAEKPKRRRIQPFITAATVLLLAFGIYRATRNAPDKSSAPNLPKAVSPAPRPDVESVSGPGAPTAPSEATGTQGRPPTKKVVRPTKPLVLSPHKAQFHGDGIQIETVDGKPNVGFWGSSGDWVEWDLDPAVTGRFEVTAEIAGLSQSRFTVEAGGKALTANSSATGSYNAYQVMQLGRLSVGPAGAGNLIVRPIKGSWRAINLRTVVLKPID